MHDSSRILLELFLLFGAAKLCGEIFERLKQPEVIGEIIAGILIGPYMLGWVHGGEFLDAIGELGVIILLFRVGLETHVGELRKVGLPALVIGVAGIILPFVLGAGLMFALRHNLSVALFIGTSLVATSVGVTARVLADLGALQTKAARLILGAAVIDDILAMLLLAVVSGMGEASFRWKDVVLVAVPALAFVTFVTLIGTYIFRRHAAILDAPQIKESPFILALLLCLGLSALANTVGLAAIIGAFLAGMVIAETREQYGIEHQIGPVYAFLVPFFFAATGMKVDVRVLGSGPVLGLAAALIALAIIGKLIGCGLAARSQGRRNAWIVGVGMIPRGEVGIIVASLGLKLGKVDKSLYAVVVIMSIVTTLIVPPVLKRLLDAPEAEVSTPPEVETSL